MNLRRTLISISAAIALAAPWCSPRASAGESSKPGRQLSICADPNNMPFSNDKLQGFENQLAALLARELHAKPTYYWWPQRRGFLKRTLNARHCDVVMGLPSGFERVLTTSPVYRSTYVFVTKTDGTPIRSLDAPELQSARIGVPLVGDDGANPSPVAALVRRGLAQNLRGYTVYGDYRKESPPADIIRAVRRGAVDVAIAWGPLAGYYAHRGSPVLRVTPLPAAEAPPGQPFAFDISLAVRKDDRELLAELEQALSRRRARVRALLEQYHFPQL